MKVNTQKAKGAASIAVIAALCLATLAAVPLMATTHKSHDNPKSITTQDVGNDILPQDALLPKDAVQADVPVVHLTQSGTAHVVEMGQSGTVSIVDADGNVSEEPVFDATASNEVPVYDLSDDDVMSTPVSFTEAINVSAKAVLNSIAEQAKVKIDASAVKDVTLEKISLEGARFEEALRALARSMNAKWTRVSDHEFKLE